MVSKVEILEVGIGGLAGFAGFGVLCWDLRDWSFCVVGHLDG